MSQKSDNTKSNQDVDDTTKLDLPSKSPQHETTSRLTPGLRSESTDSARPISTTSKDAVSEGATSSTTKSRRKKEKPLPPGAHRVTITTHISLAIPAVDIEPPPAESPQKGGGEKKKKKVSEAPKAQNHFHCEFQLIPEDKSIVKVDVVIYGIAAKIYPEGSEAKIVKTWNNAGLTWVAWTHNNIVVITEDVLKKMVKHKIELKVWDTREKLSQRARFDRPKTFRLPQPKPGEDPDTVGGVKHLVLKQSRLLEEQQPKRPYIDRPLPVSRPSTTSDRSGETSRHSKDSARRNLTDKKANKSSKDLNKNIKMYNKITQLADTETPHLGTKSAADMIPPGQVEYAGPSQRRAVQRQLDQKLPQLNSDEEDQPHIINQEKQINIPKAPPTAESEVSIATKKKRKQKAAALAQVELERAKKFGICSIATKVAEFFAGRETYTSRLSKPSSGVLDLLVTFNTNGSLMTAEQQSNLNPFIIKIQGATNMPATPMPFDELRFRCQPAFIKYKVFGDDSLEHVSCGREQDADIYWDDVNVLLAGTMDPALLRQNLFGPPLTVEVHDRDRIIEKPKLKPTLFGDDLEDEKISNVGLVSSKRTIYNPFSSDYKPWDPYGVSSFDLSPLLLGQRTVYMSAPILCCHPPDLLGKQNSDGGKLYGISGAVDGPQEAPLPTGHYMEAQSVLKISVHLSCPLVTPVQLAEGIKVQGSEKSAFGRIIFKFAYKNVQFLQKLQNLLININAETLQLNKLPDDVIPTALSTYKLSVEQQKDPTLDIVTGFHMMDGRQHLFVLEGIQQEAILRLWTELPKPYNTDVEVLYNSDLLFNERLYGPLDVDICRIKLHEALDLIVQQPLLYVRDMVPKLCFESLIKLKQLTDCLRLRDAIRNDVFPSAEMVISMSREFGVPLTTEDYEELKGGTETPVDGYYMPLPPSKTSRLWTPIDHVNTDYIQQKHIQKVQGNNKDYVQQNKDEVTAVSAVNGMERSKTLPVYIQQTEPEVHPYSSQARNSTELAHEKLRQTMAQNPSTRYTFCKDFHHSMTLVPDNISALQKSKEELSKQQWKSPTGWHYPGKKTMGESNQHSKQPDVARRELLTTPWEENTLHSNMLKPTLVKRERYDWTNRYYDMDIWTKPPPLEIPLSIHEAGVNLKAEKTTSQEEEQREWKAKLMVEDPFMRFHRCATETELNSRGFKSSNQVEKLKGLLKDEPKKLALRNPGVNLTGISSLNVVLNPSVDTEARMAGVPLPVLETAKREKTKGFHPGPYLERTWQHEDNRIPSYDYKHHQFTRLKGKDFNVYHKDRGALYRKHINPLSDDEYNTDLFRWSTGPHQYNPYTHQYILPTPEDLYNTQQNGQNVPINA